MNNLLIATEQSVLEVKLNLSPIDKLLSGSVLYKVT